MEVNVITKKCITQILYMITMHQMHIHINSKKDLSVSV